MCVIIHKPSGILFPESDIESAEIVNPHGFGYMYFDQKTGRIKADRSTEMSIGRIKDTFRKFKDKEACFHFRFKTHGNIGTKQCHPFRVLDKTKHGTDMYFMHNGTIASVKKTDMLEGESDTQAFNRLVLHPILRENPDLISNKAFQKLIREYIGFGSKLCFMYGNGKIIKINEEAGDTRADCWVSNLYSFNRQHREPAKTTFSSNNYNSNSQIYRTSYQCNNTNKNVVSITNNKTAVMFEQVIKQDSPIYVFRPADQDFMSEGLVSAIYEGGKAVVIKFPLVKKGPITFLKFNVANGESEANAYYADGEFFAYPAEGFDVSLVNVGGTKKNNNVISDQEEAEVSDDKKGDDGATKKGNTDVEEKDEFHVTSGGMTVDSKNRYGSGAFNGTASNDLYLEYGGVTIGDFFEMSGQERFDFFVEDTESSFNMLQDVIEFLVLEDEGLFPEDGEIDFVDDEKEKEGETE